MLQSGQLRQTDMGVKGWDGWGSDEGGQASLFPSPHLIPTDAGKPVALACGGCQGVEVRTGVRGSYQL